MFEALKKKFASFVSKSKEEKEKPEKISSKSEKKKKSRDTSKSQVKQITSQLIDNKQEIPTEPIQVYDNKKDAQVEPQTSNQTDNKKPTFFSKLKQKLTTSELSKEQFDEIFEDLEITLLENNVALETVDKIKENLEKDLVGISIEKKEIDNKILTSLKQAILSVLIEPPNLIEQIKKSNEPYKIVFFGINGSGKTTSIAKLAHYLKQKGISCVLAAADTFRAASIEQLKAHGEKLKIPVIAQDYNSDPTAVAYDAIEYAKKHKIQAVLIDTAGRMYTQSNLLREMDKIMRVTKPDLKIFVGESITGNDATEQAKIFNRSVGIDGIILSKADIDKKAGTILSVSQVTNKPIYFLGTGQNYQDLTPFTKKTILKNLGLN